MAEFTQHLKASPKTKGIDIYKIKTVGKGKEKQTQIECRAYNVQPGDKINAGLANYTVQEILENRDHRGQFNNPKLSKQSFYRLKVA